MRIAFLLLFVCAALQCAAQTKPKPTAGPKTIPGILKDDVKELQLPSRDGNQVAISYIEGHKVIDVAKGSIREIPAMRQLRSASSTEYQYFTSHLSPDYRYQYHSGTEYIKSLNNGDGAYRIATRVHGIYDDSRDTLVGDYFIFGMDDAGHLIGSKANFYSDRANIESLRGLYILDRKSGAVLSTLRTDSLYEPGRFGCCGGYNGAPEEWYLHPEFLLIRYGQHTVQVFPFNSSKVVTATTRDKGDWKAALTTSKHFFFEKSDFYGVGYQLTAFDRETGAEAGALAGPYVWREQLLLAAGPDGLYHYNLATGKMYANTINGGKFFPSDSFAIGGLELPDQQQWQMRIMKGPSALFIPGQMRAAEGAGQAANTASLASLGTRTVAFRIAPFFIRSGGEIAKEQSAIAAYNAGAAERKAKAAAEEAAALAKRCKESWGTSEYARGKTREWESALVIMESYDCAKDEYRLFRPVPPEHIHDQSHKPSFTTAEGKLFRTYSRVSFKQYHTCAACDGVGRVEETTTRTRTKDLPWGYFSGIETRSTRTTTTTEVKRCVLCGGRGIVLK